MILVLIRIRMKIVKVLERTIVTREITPEEDIFIGVLRRFDYGKFTLLKKGGEIVKILAEESIIFER